MQLLYLLVLWCRTAEKNGMLWEQMVNELRELDVYAEKDLLENMNLSYLDCKLPIRQRPRIGSAEIVIPFGVSYCQCKFQESLVVQFLKVHPLPNLALPLCLHLQDQDC